MLKKKYYDGTQVHRIISEEVKDYDTIMKILKRFADEPSALGTNLAEVGTDTISRQAAIDAIGEVHPLDYNAQAIKTRIESLSSAQPMRKKGKWIYNSPVTMKCDQCEYVVRDWFVKQFRYCPNCGAKMDGGDS